MTKTHILQHIFFSWLSWISHLYQPVPIIKVIFTLFSVSYGLFLWNVSHTSINENPALAVFSIVNVWGAVVINCPDCLSGTNVNKTFGGC